MHLAIPSEEVKNGTPVEAELPPDLVKLLDLYLLRHRPLLSDSPSDWLFPGKIGNAKSDQSIRLQVLKTVKRRCGMDIHPHLFRHTSGKFYLEDHPGAYGVVRLVLGHTSVETTRQYYSGFEGKAALRHYANYVITRRAGIKTRIAKIGD